MGLICVVGVIIIWWIVAFVVSDSVILPSPADTGHALLHYFNRPYPARGDTLLGNTAASLVRILVGFAGGAVAGTMLGAIMSAVRPPRLPNGTDPRDPNQHHQSAASVPATF